MSRFPLLVTFLNVHLLHPVLGQYLTPRAHNVIWK